MHDARPRGGSRRTWDAVAVALAALVCALTLLPAERSAAPTALGPPPPALADALRNLALFLPLGAALALARHPAVRIVALCAALSAGIEVLQLAVPGRIASLADLASNALGGAAGAALVLARAGWLAPAGRAAAWLCGLVLAANWSAVVLTGQLFSAQVPEGSYYGGWTPEFEGMDRYRGRILSARIGEREIAEGGPVDDPAALSGALRAGEPLRLHWEAGPAPLRLAPLVVVIGPGHEEVALIAARGPDLVLRRWRASARFLLEQPELTWPRALAGIAPGTRTDLVATPEGSGVSFEIRGGRRQRVGLGPGRGWALLAPDVWVPPDRRASLDALWQTLLLLPVGLWLPHGWRAIPLAVLAVTPLWLLPESVGLSAAAAPEWAGAAAGLLLGRLVSKAANASPAEPGDPAPQGAQRAVGERRAGGPSPRKRARTGPRKT